MARSKPGVMIYFETGKAIKGLDYETKGRLFEAIMEYAEFGAVPEFDGVLSAVWPFVADKIDHDSARYEDKREKNRINGLISNFKRNYAPAHSIDKDDKVALAEYIRNNTATVNDCERSLTAADDIERIQPTTTATATTTATTTTTATATTTTPATTDAKEGIRDNEQREKGLNLTIQPNTNISDRDNSDSKAMKKKAILIDQPPMHTECIQTVSKMDTQVRLGKDSIRESGADKPPARSRFFPPTVDEVSAYCKEKGYSVDAERFVNYYTSNGWMVGKNKMKDWKAAVRNWNGKGQEHGKTESKLSWTIGTVV